MLRTANHRLFQNGAGLHAAPPRRPDHAAQIGLLRHHAPLPRPMLRARAQLLHLQPAALKRRPASFISHGQQIAAASRSPPRRRRALLHSRKPRLHPPSQAVQPEQHRNGHPLRHHSLQLGQPQPNRPEVRLPQQSTLRRAAPHGHREQPQPQLALEPRKTTNASATLELGQRQPQTPHPLSL